MATSDCCPCKLQFAHLLQALSAILHLLGHSFDKLLLLLPFLVLNAKSLILQPTKYKLTRYYLCSRAQRASFVAPINAHLSIAQLSQNTTELESLKVRPQ